MLKFRLEDIFIPLVAYRVDVGRTVFDFHGRWLIALSRLKRVDAGKD
jgi:hypothetical protein